MVASEPFNRLPYLLGEAGYHRSDIDAVEELLRPDHAELMGLRRVLEQFFRASTQMDKAVRFHGNTQSFGACLDFARSRNWLTAAEQRFVSALYGLLSDAAAHDGPSLIEPDFARQAVLHAVWLVINRFEVRASRPFHGYGGSVGRLKLAEQFMKGVRTGGLTGPAFQVPFDQDLMQLTRQLLRYADIHPLMAVIKNDQASAHLRSLCASLILSPRCYRKPRDDNWPKVVSELDHYCQANLRFLPWQVSRCIALALVNRTNHPDRLLDYLEWVGNQSDLVERNLADSDAYYGGVEEAAGYFYSRIESVNIPLSGCVWEAFYIARRPSSKRAFVRKALERRLNELEPGRLRAFFESTIDYASGRFSKTAGRVVKMAANP